MNTHKDPTSSENRPAVDEQRRRLTKGGLAAPIVIGALLSRPVLGAAPHNCTISGQISGNVSTHGTPVDCKTLGRSPGYWKTHNPWPNPTVYGSPAAGTCVTNATVGTRFNGFQINGATFLAAFRCKKGVVLDPQSTDWSTTTTKATMLQVLNTGGGLNDTAIFALGRATVASLLNSLFYAPNYPLKPEQVIAMFNAVYLGGKYQVNPTTFWDRDQVKIYFESLYGSL
ncbi:MAG: hypothetical protein B7Y41_01570 [Hydrogenophilales bacterium 28-61-23]|nr:MAG: hypothetical protein B7Y41_01570 [Hydrogenophilales bacterium 28-61-23]